MRTVGAESECAGELRGVGGLAPTIHNTWYYTIYHLSIYIYTVLFSKLVRGEWWRQRKVKIRTLEKRKLAAPKVTFGS